MTDERLYPVRNPEIIAKEQADYLAKIEKNKAEGLRVLSSGDYPLFNGWAIKDSGRTFDTILELDEPSQQRIIEEVSDPLYELAQKYQIPVISPGRGDGPPHTVLEPGKFTNLDSEQIESIKKYLASNKSHINLLAKILEGLTFHHDTLVIAAPTIYICASQFDAEQGGVFRARRVMDRVIAHALVNLKATSPQSVAGNFAPSYYHDIFHSSVLRFTEEKAPVESVIAFVQEAYSTIGTGLKRNPIPVTVRHLYRGIATDYQRHYAPNLVIP